MDAAAAAAWLAAHRGRGAPLAEGLACFDALAPVACDEMLGEWDGEEFPTGHPMDGLLRAHAWRGKTFVDAERVHPLVFARGDGTRFAVDPRRIPMGLAPHRWLAQSWPARMAVRLLMPLLRTAAPRARLRTVTCRGVATASMVYDHLPIIDSFRRVDADTLLGLMDRRGEPHPFLFVLRRSGGAAPA